MGGCGGMKKEGRAMCFPLSSGLNQCFQAHLYIRFSWRT